MLLQKALFWGKIRSLSGMKAQKVQQSVKKWYKIALILLQKVVIADV